MGGLLNKDTRKISFDNTLASSPILPCKFIEDDEFIDIRNFSDKNDQDLINLNNSNASFEDDADYWAKRIASLKTEHQLINQIMEREYIETMQANQSLLPKINPSQLERSRCLDWQNKVLKCYEQNSHQTLNCSAIVEAFNNCITACQSEH